MPPQHNSTEQAVYDPSGATVTLGGVVESASVRVLLDGGTRECRTCDSTIAAGNRYLCLTLRDGDGSVTVVPFCGDECAAEVTPRPE
jgi:hypothetical protein